MAVSFKPLQPTATKLVVSQETATSNSGLTSGWLLPAVHVASNDDPDRFYPTRNVPHAIETTFGQQLVVTGNPMTSSRLCLIRAEEPEPFVVLVATPADS